MKIRFASVLLALALPLAAQDSTPSPTEALFYKAFYLEKGQMDYAGAMVLYDQFLAEAPEHALAQKAAERQFDLLDRTGKTKERDAFRAKYQKLLGDRAVAGERPARPGAEGAGRGAEGGRGAGRPDPAARMAELEKQLAEAKEEGDTERIAQLEQQLQRLRQAGERGRGPGGRPGLFGDKKLADMSEDELGQFKEGLARMEPMLERMRERLGDEQADKLDTNLGALKKALEADDLAGAQKALDTLREAMPRRQRGNRGEGGGEPGEGGGRGRGRARGGDEGGGR